MSIQILQEKIREKSSPIIVALNPTLEMVPPSVLEIGRAKYGTGLKGAAESVRLYCRGLIEALAPTAAGVLFSPTCYLRYGSEGIAALEDLIVCARSNDLYVIIDARCADDGYLATAAAEAWIGTAQSSDALPMAWDCDAVTVSGYSGTGSLRPFTALCNAFADHGKAVFLIAHTNSGTSREVQELITGTRVVYTAVADLAVRLTRLEQLSVDGGYSAIGLVAGMNRAGELANLRRSYPELFLLIPEYGVTGSHSKDIQGAMDSLGRGAAVCVSTQLLTAWQQADDGSNAGYRAAAKAVADRIRKNLTKGIRLM